MSWRVTVAAASLESESYRERIGVIMDAADRARMSEHEAQMQFGEFVASLIMLQRRVRGWIEVRRRNKDHEKVTCRSQYEFSSYLRPDRKAERMRCRQRSAHGWRAPLDKAYAQLGSSSSDPLSRTHDVHTALASTRRRRAVTSTCTRAQRR